MRARCIASLPSPRQAESLGQYYRPGKQAFGIVPGNEYLVFALKFLGGQPWIDVTQDDNEPRYLFSVPLCLFEIVDNRVPTIWRIRVDDTVGVKLAPESLFKQFYYDDLFEGVAAVVSDFQQVRHTLEIEDRGDQAGFQSI